MRKLQRNRPSLFIKDSNNVIRKVGGNLDVNLDGNVENLDFDLAYVVDPNKGTINATNATSGDVIATVDLPLADETNAGLFKVGDNLIIGDDGEISASPPVFVCTPSEIDNQNPPADSEEGTLWWNTNEGVLYVWYEDATPVSGLLLFRKTYKTSHLLLK